MRYALISNLCTCWWIFFDVILYQQYYDNGIKCKNSRIFEPDIDIGFPVCIFIFT